eukprot:1151275-Pelagomonas_calceolata.AAC.9
MATQMRALGKHSWRQVQTEARKVHDSCPICLRECLLNPSTLGDTSGKHIEPLAPCTCPELERYYPVVGAQRADERPKPPIAAHTHALTSSFLPSA